jgi:hypothetical protein
VSKTNWWDNEAGEFKTIFHLWLFVLLLIGIPGLLAWALHAVFGIAYVPYF